MAFPVYVSLELREDVAGDFGSDSPGCRAPSHTNSGHSELLKAC